MIQHQLVSVAMTLLPAISIGWLAAPAASAQSTRGGVENKAYEDAIGGYRLRPPKGWALVPVSPDDRESGLTCRMDPPNAGNPEGGRMRVVRVASDEELLAWVGRLFAESGIEVPETFAEDPPDLDESATIDKLPAHHRRWLVEAQFVDTWLVEREASRLGLIFMVAEEDRFASSWLLAFERSAESLELFEPRAFAGTGAGASYEDQLEYARAEAALTPGWRVVPTPSKKFILTTSSENQKFIEEVIDRLERSRQIYEEDYPPPAGFSHVSTVRLCDNAEEFHRYGGTGEGTMGWFNLASTELVLYDAKDVDRNMSYAVMTHEAFHQYCFFLFGRSEAHRWFDEGHGDYYGGIQFPGRGKPKVTDRMPGGLNRREGIKELITIGTYAPLEKHLNFDHGQWQTQGPENTSCYEQSWSIVYMLRQGMLGNVDSKVWRDEYAAILPNYIETLRQGFEDAYAEAQRTAEEEAAKNGARPPTDPPSSTATTSGRRPCAGSGSRPWTLPGDRSISSASRKTGSCTSRSTSKTEEPLRTASSTACQEPILRSSAGFPSISCFLSFWNSSFETTPLSCSQASRSFEASWVGEI